MEVEPDERASLGVADFVEVQPFRAYWVTAQKRTAGVEVACESHRNQDSFWVWVTGLLAHLVVVVEDAVHSSPNISANSLSASAGRTGHSLE
jgi:hypothetical protein